MAFMFESPQKAGTHLKTYPGGANGRIRSILPTDFIGRMCLLPDIYHRAWNFRYQKTKAATYMQDMGSLLPKGAATNAMYADDNLLDA